MKTIFVHNRYRYICVFMIVVMFLSIIYIHPMIKMNSVQAASYVAAGEYDGIGADKISNCVAFARYMVPSLPGGLYNLQDKINIINSHTPTAGVIAITSGDSSYGHVAYVESVSGGNVVTLNGGFSGSGLDGHIVRITGTESEQGILGYWYPANIPPIDPAAVVYYSSISVEYVDNWNAELYGRIENPNRYKIDGVGVHVWDSAGNLVVDHTEGCGLTTSYVEQRLNIVAEALANGLNSGETYTFEMFAGVNGTNVKSSIGTFTCVDSIPPVITEVKVSDVGSDGYTVTCKVTDNFKVDRVQFPTWTLENEQDDLLEDWGSNSLYQGIQSGDTYTFRVRRSDHNGESGLYRTHIYAWDKAGNMASSSVEDVLVEKDDETPKVEKAEIKEITADRLTVHVEASDNKGLRSISWMCRHTYKEMGEIGPFVAYINANLNEIIYPQEKTFSGDITIDLTGYQRISDYHVLNIIVTDTGGNTIFHQIPFFLASDNENEMDLYIGEEVTTDQLYEQMGITNKGSWVCTYDEDESILKKEREDEKATFTAVKKGLEYVYFSQLMTGEGRGFKINVLDDSSAEEKVQLIPDSPLKITEEGNLTGLIQNKNSVQEIREQFAEENVVIKDATGKVLAETDILGTGATVSIMDGDTVKASCQVVLVGDVNGDGKVNGKDVSMLARSLVGKATLTDVQKEAAEVLVDGAINGKDVSKLARSLVGKATISSQAK